MTGNKIDKPESQLDDVFRLKKGGESGLEQPVVNEQTWNQVLTVLRQVEEQIAKSAESNGFLQNDVTIQNTNKPTDISSESQTESQARSKDSLTDSKSHDLIAQATEDPWKGYEQKYGQYHDKVQAMGNHMLQKFEADQKAYNADSHHLKNVDQNNQGWQGYEQKYGYLKQNPQYQALQKQYQGNFKQAESLNQRLDFAQQEAIRKGEDPNAALRNGIADFNKQMATQDPEFAKGLRQQAKADAEARRLSMPRNYYDGRTPGSH